MYIYLDNNILIDYEDGKKRLPMNSETKYTYSYVHLLELQELKDTFIEKKSQRLQTIKKATQCRYILSDDKGKLALFEVDPSVIFSQINEPLAKMVQQTIHERISLWPFDKNPKLLMDKLNIEKKIINNYTPNDLVKEYGYIIHNFIEETSNSTTDMFLSLFNILDALGYWQDKAKCGSSMNRIYDAKHAYFASFCDYFVTDDKNTKNKANVAYKLFQNKTKAMSYEEFKNIFT
ncbi:MAG: hypothetical protein E7070_07670 [Bacteroidales bacterium]|jgi:hypothetical protein|nr:hypothetical protein [Bacteroidales bacterium]